jgi:hypothetical protein
MSRLHFGIGCSPVGDVLIVQKAERGKRYLVDFAGKAADPSSGREFVKATHPILLGDKLDEYRLHSRSPFVGKV